MPAAHAIGFPPNVVEWMIGLGINTSQISGGEMNAESGMMPPPIVVEFVHSDRLGDLPQGERPQLGDAVAEEAVLLLDDLGRDLDDGPGALVERLDQPVGAGQAFADSQALERRSAPPVSSA